MAKEQAFLSTEIVNQGVQESGPNAGSMTFSVRVRRRLPDFLQSGNLKYAKLGYHYLISHAVYLFSVPVLLLAFSAEIGSLSQQDLWRLWEQPHFDMTTMITFSGATVFMLCLYFMSQPRSVYLVDFACFKPSDELKVSKEDFVSLAKKSGHFDDNKLGFPEKNLGKIWSGRRNLFAQSSNGLRTVLHNEGGPSRSRNEYVGPVKSQRFSSAREGIEESCSVHDCLIGACPVKKLPDKSCNC